MVANLLPTDTPLTQGVGSKVKLYIFLKVVMLHITLAAQVANFLPTDTPSTLKVVMFHIKLKGNEHRAP